MEKIEYWCPFCETRYKKLVEKCSFCGKEIPLLEIQQLAFSKVEKGDQDFSYANGSS